jgi:glutamine phosphoribosylpyrophosphate amidotransferase
MCGVLGWIGNPKHWRDSHRLMVELAIASEERGTDAAGYAALTASGELLWRRQPGPARHLFLGREFAALRRRLPQAGGAFSPTGVAPLVPVDP